MTQHRLPNLIIAGVPKAGTTSMFNYLAQHPDISPSERKETRYFNILRSHETTATIETYAAFFSRWQDERYALEATPTYFQGGRSVARAIRETLPRARVLLSLREPSDRCWSYFRFWKSRGRIPGDMSFEAYLDHCEGLKTRSGDHLRENGVYFGLTGGCYAKWLCDWYTEFGQHLKVVYFDDLSTDASATIKEICSWLDIDARVIDTFDLAAENQTKLVRSGTAQQLALRVNRRAERFFREHPRIKRRLRSAYYLANGDLSEPAVSAASAERMAAFYAPHNALLAEQLEAMGEALPPWLPPQE